ncbi:MAG: DUF3224 domain-containing protein [Thaumarchaeota archaeon]|nr:DUF3224 domain-containing protein [Nitrososphaerota archaeon]
MHLTNPYARKATILVVASILLLAGVAAISPSLAAGGPAIESKKIRATGNLATIVGATYHAAVPIDLPPTDGVPDITARDRLLASTYSGTLQGTGVSVQTLTQFPAEGISTSSALGTFTGTLGDSKLGSFSLILKLTFDTAAFPPPVGSKFEGPFIVVQDSGQGGLEGICGSGMIQGTIGTPSVSTYDITFQFGEACNSANP